MRKGSNVLKRGMAVLFALAMIVSGICFMGMDANKVYAATSTVKESTGYNDEGYFVKQYEEISTYKTADTYPILDGTEYTDAQDWLFAGWYTTEECTTSIGRTTQSGTAWAKFVHIDVLSVKCQVENDVDADTDKTNMRLISTLDSLKYDTVGFKVRYNGGEELDFPVSKVFKRINASEINGNECGYSPVAFHETSEYFMTYSLLNIANKNFSKPFYIEPYWVTLDGTEVRGASRFARVEDRYLEIVNVPVRLHATTTVTGGSVTVDYSMKDEDGSAQDLYELYSIDEVVQYDNGTVFDTVTVSDNATNRVVTVTATEQTEGAQAKGMFVNLRFQMIADTMPSASTFEIASSNFNVSDFIFRNFPLTYSGGYDISWYTGYEDSDTFAIASAADLYGLAALSNGTAGVGDAVNFATKTIYLCSDITVNEGDPLVDGWATTAPKHMWTSIGSKTAFAGTFNGQGNTINGIYVNDGGTKANYVGLFGTITEDATIRDFSLKNSCFINTATDGLGWGSIAGRCSGKALIQDVYSNAQLICGGRQMGGILGVKNTANTEVTVDSCWFEGSITLNGDGDCARAAGGIAGASAGGTVTIDNCLNTGNIITNRTNIGTKQQALGGLFGIDWGMSTITIENSLNAGTITVNVNEENAKADIGSIVGRIGNKDSLFTITNTYATEESWTGEEAVAGVGSKNGGNKGSKTLEVTRQPQADFNGHVAYDTINDGLSVLTSKVKDGAWAIREQSDVLKKGVPVPVAFVDEWIDVAWYYDTEGNDYSISTVEELYGFSAISRGYDFNGETIQGDNFDGDTIQLANDITANDGKATSWEKGTIPSREWTPIGNSTTPFQGTFDGQKHFIKGIYVNATTQNAGLFGYAEDATIQDLQLINSYIHTTVDRVGGIAGYYTGDMYRVYCDAIVVSTRNAASDCGGLIGYYEKIANTDEISECWFAGTAKGYTRTGGIVGYLRNGRKEISDTLVTGTVITTNDIRNAQIGGIVGSLNDYAGAVLDITSSLGAGTMQDSYTGTLSHQTGGVVGYKPANATVTIDNVYTTFSEGLGTQNNDLENSAVEADYLKIENIDDVKGSLVYTNDVMNLGYYLYDSTWIARTTDIPVPRCFVGTVVDENDIVEDTSAHTAWYDADTEATEFEIKTENDFLGFAVIVNEGEKFSGKTIKLAKNMDLNRGWNAPETVDEEVVVPDITWTPIGNNAKIDNVNNRFQGTFDGQGHTIRGVYVESSSNYVGLFGYVNNNATIKNLQLTNSYFKGTNLASLCWGSIAGQLDDATLLNTYSDAVMCYAGRQIGGLVGSAKNTVTVERCWFDGEIDASYVKDNGDADVAGAGGIVGVTAAGNSNTLHITDCLNTGNLKSTATHSSNQNIAISFGGIFGTDWAASTVIISGCLNKGELNTVLHQGVGAIVGRANGTKAEDTTSVYTITGCYALDTSIKDRTFEDIGYINTTNNPSVTPDTQEARCPSKEIDQLVGEDIYAEGGLDLNYATWIARTTDVPVPTYFVGSVVAEEDTVKDNTGRVYADTTWYTQDKNASTYSIGTAHELAGLAKLVNDDGITFDNITINLVKDIDLNEEWTAPATTADAVEVPVNTWMPIGNSSSVSFQGTFNGNGNTIRGIYVDEDVETTYTGLFGYTKTCAVTELRLENSYFSTTNPYMGSIIGYGNGTLTNVYSDAIMHSTSIEVGGLVGRGVKEGSDDLKLLTMTGCWFNGDIRVVPSAANAYVGGLVGYAYTSDAIIDTCLYTGDITLIYTSTTTSNPNTRSGGLIGADNNSYAYASISNTISAGTINGIMEGTATAINNLCTTIGQIRYTSTTCSNIYDMSVVTKVIGETSSTSTAKCGGTTTNVDTVKSNIDQTYAKEDIFGLGAQLLTNLSFTDEHRIAADSSITGEEVTVAGAIWAARRGQLPAPAGLVADSDKLNVQFGKADQEIADGATGDSAEDPYIIESVEELYGFAILSRTDAFADKYIKLGDNIDVNPDESAEDWAKGTAASLPWYSIGTSSNRFAGHFDGEVKTISGIYMNQDNSYLGLFAATDEGSSIENLRIMNSYINYTGNGTAYTGSGVGDLRGDMTNVYSDAIVNSNGTQTGGLIGQVNEVSEDEAYAVDITNCWYDGQLTSSKTYAGGLLASTAEGTVNVDNCLNTGRITTTATSGNANNAVAGICAQVTGASVVSITDTISAGKITDADHGKNVKSVVAYIPNGTVSFENVFATKTSYARTYPSKNAENGAYTGTVLRTQESDRFIGYCVEELVEGDVQLQPKLEFGTNEWTIRTSDVPVPTCFADLVTPVTDAELNTQVGLDYLNEALSLTDDAALTLANAVDMGEGNYVLNATVDDTVYATYKSTLEGRGYGTPAVANIADRVHSVSYKQTNPDWVLTLTYVETTDALTISINTNTDSLSDKLVTSGDEISYATGDVKFTMLQMEEYVVDDEGNETPLEDIYADLSGYYFNNNSYWYGNSFVFQVSEDHFVVNDGGAKEEYDDLVNYMKAAVGTTEDGVQKPVYIDAWTISHQHGDHADVLKAVADTPTLAEGIYVDAFYISEPNAKILTDNALYDDAEKQYYAMTLFAKNESGEQSDIYRMHTGQRYNFNGLVMDVIQTQDQIPYSEYGDYNANNSDTKDFNTASTITLFSVYREGGDVQKVLIGGDANYVNMEYIMKAYDTNETDGDNYTPTSLLQNINVFAAFHHGKNMSMKLSTLDTSFIDYLTYGDHTFDYVLYPCSLVYGDDSDPVNAFPNAGEANAYLNGKVKNNQYYHFGDGNVEITLPGATTE